MTDDTLESFLSQAAEDEAQESEQEEVEQEAESEPTQEEQESVTEEEPPVRPGERKWIDYIAKKYDLDLSQYADDVEAMRALVHARRLVGRRAEDAATLNEIRKKYGDGVIEVLLKTDPDELMKTQRTKEEIARDEVPFDESWLQMVRRDENGDLVPVPGAPPDVVPKLKAFALHREKLMNDLAKSPKRFVLSLIQDAVDKMVDAKLRAFGSAYSKVHEQNEELSRWVDEHRSQIFDEDGGLTPLGERFVARADDIIEEHQRAYGSADTRTCFDQAWREVTSGVRQVPKDHSPARKAAMHGKSVKTKEDFKDKQQLFKDLLAKDGVSLADAYDAVMRHGK